MKFITDLKDERGSAGILVIVLLFLSFSIIVMVTSVDFFQQVIETNRVKRDLALATHAAAMDVDKVKLAEGILALEPLKSNASFYNFLQKNMRLDRSNQPLPESYLLKGPVIHKLLYVDYEEGTIQPLLGDASNCSLSDKEITCSVVANAGTAKVTTRTIAEPLAGPSVVSVIEVEHNRFSIFAPEPIVVADTQQVLFTY